MGTTPERSIAAAQPLPSWQTATRKPPRHPPNTVCCTTRPALPPYWPRHPPDTVCCSAFTSAPSCSMGSLPAASTCSKAYEATEWVTQASVRVSQTAGGSRAQSGNSPLPAASSGSWPASVAWLHPQCAAGHQQQHVLGWGPPAPPAGLPARWPPPPRSRSPPRYAWEAITGFVFRG